MGRSDCGRGAAGTCSTCSQFNNDLLAIYRDLKVQEQKSGHRFVSYPARRVAPSKKLVRAAQGDRHRFPLTSAPVRIVSLAQLAGAAAA